MIIIIIIIVVVVDDVIFVIKVMKTQSVQTQLMNKRDGQKSIYYC